MQEAMMALADQAGATAEALKRFAEVHPSGRRRGVTIAPYPSADQRKARRKAQKQSRRGNR